MKVNRESVQNLELKAGTIIENKYGEFYIIGADVHRQYYAINLKTGYVSMEKYDSPQELIKSYFSTVYYYDNDEAELNLGGRK